MNERKAFCPQCKREVAFMATGRLRMCPECGFQYELAAAPSVFPSQTQTAWKTVFGVLATVLLIMGAVVVVGVAILFAGCAGLLKGF